MGSCKKTSHREVGDGLHIRKEHTNFADANFSDREEQSGAQKRGGKVEPKSDGNESGVMNKSKRKRNRRKESKKNKVTTQFKSYWCKCSWFT